MGAIPEAPAGCWIGIASAAAVFFAGPTEYGVAYPVWFMGTSHTYGVVGLSWLLLVIGAFLAPIGIVHGVMIWLGMPWAF